VLGAILLVSPLAVVVFQESACAGSQTHCFGDSVNKYVDTFLPYVMLSGGLFVGYSMKRIADSHIVETEDESEPDEQS
jgi:hypothetical protein